MVLFSFFRGVLRILNGVSYSLPWQAWMKNIFGLLTSPGVLTPLKGFTRSSCIFRYLPSVASICPFLPWLRTHMTKASEWVWSGDWHSCLMLSLIFWNKRKHLFYIVLNNLKTLVVFIISPPTSPAGRKHGVPGRKRVFTSSIWPILLIPFLKHIYNSRPIWFAIVT